MSRVNMKRYNLRLQRVEVNELNRVLAVLERRLDRLEGVGQNPSFHGARLKDVASLSGDSTLAWDRDRSTLALRVSEDGALALRSGGLAVQVADGGGLTIDSGGLSIESRTDPGDALEVVAPLVPEGGDGVDRSDLETRLATLTTEINAAVSVLNTVLQRLREANVLA
jgi:hypothetical protein